MESNENNTSLIYYIYWFSTVYVLVKILSFLWSLVNNYLLPYLREPQDFTRYGQWAVITGSTDGIGKGFAKELASKGVDICLISRSEEKLKNTAKEIEESYAVKTKYIVADFTDPNIYTHIKGNLAGLDIGILVNNVGIFPDTVEAFSRHSEELIKKMVNVNMLSTAMMTSIILQSMIPKKRGLIINLSSTAGEACAPYLIMYSGCKAFMTLFGTGLFYEVKRHNIQVTTLIPGFVSTKMVLNHASVKSMLFGFFSFIIPSVDRYVKSALLSLSSRDLKCTGYFIHEIFLIIVKFISVDTLNKLFTLFYGPRKHDA